VLLILVLLVVEVLWLLGTASSAVETPEYEAYVVSQTRTLASIAADYGLPTDYLAKYNRLAADATVNAGQVILVPVVTQLAPQLTGTPDASATTPAGDLISGLIGNVRVRATDILSRPGKGTPLFSNAPQGTRLLVTGQAGDYYAVLMSDGSTGFVPRNDVELTDTQMQVPRPKTTSTLRASGGVPKIVDTAMEYLGIPYQYGGRLPATVDCSLLVQTVFKRNGMKLPRTAAQQYTVGQPIEVDGLQSGDRLYFANTSGYITHTAIYIGNGRFIHASSNRGQVAIDELANPTYWKKYAGARR
jgi:cell wall-associated NlpC family hydrolase